MLLSGKSIVDGNLVNRQDANEVITCHLDFRGQTIARLDHAQVTKRRENSTRLGPKVTKRREQVWAPHLGHKKGGTI